MRQKQGADRQLPTLGERERDGFSLLFSGFSLLPFVFPFFSLCSHSSLSRPAVSIFTVLHLDLHLSLSILLLLTYGYLTVSFSLCRLSFPFPLSLSPASLSLSSLHQFESRLYFWSLLSCTCPSSIRFLFGARMPVLDGLWGPDLRMRDSGLGVGVEVGVCPDEAPRSPVWGPLRMPPVTCGGGLSLALELPALIRQLRAAWRARRGGPLVPERSQASTWVEAEKEDIDVVKHDLEDRSAHLEGNLHIIQVH